jgi:hypothetical protein
MGVKEGALALYQGENGNQLPNSGDGMIWSVV